MLELDLFGYHGKILGISIDEPAGRLKSKVAQLATETTILLGEPHQFTDEHILIDDSYLGEGYGVMGMNETEAIRIFAQSEGLLLDPVYTGRAAGGMLDLIRKGYFSENETLLFWHTGGQPALFADKYRDLL